MKVKPQKRKLKLTGWYSGVNPMKSRPGWYENPLSNSAVRIYWDGSKWSMSIGGYVFGYQNLTWRGVAR